ncbi:MAG: carboxylesterase family protein [Streptosporangiaceae bacterium]|jgi:para-nitrobenzyl esterase
MLRTWTGGRAATRLLVAGVTLGALVAAAPAVSASTGGYQAPGGPVAGTANGAVRGESIGPVSEFLGIPYAAPPVGALRWQPPQPAANWSGVRDATQFAPHCPQLASPFGQASTSEDCLFLNVFTPSHRQAGVMGARSPVMVWIHGGALVTGESNDYSPTKLVEDGVTVVTINYRLGALGFLAQPALADANGQSGDYGLMDQQAALRWVQRNIASFGGDPRNVTIFGESAGGLSVLSQVASPAARGLFAKAIAESGSYNLTQASLASAEAAGQAFAAKAGCEDQTAACLRSLPVSTILASEDAAGYTPNINTEVLPQTLKTAFTTGEFNRVPVINGTNHDEWRLFVALSELEGGGPVTAANYQPMISSTLGVPASAAAAIAAEYPLSAYPSPAVALGAVGTDAIFACPALTIDQAVSNFVPTFAYEFNDENAPENFLPQLSFPYGAAHATEIQYLMDLPDVAFPGTLSAPQQQLATIMKDYWTHFAERGFPSSFGTPVWPRFDQVTQQIQSLVPPTPQTETDFTATHKCAFWAAA